MWLEEVEGGIRKEDPFTVYRYARLLAGTGIGSQHRRFGQIRAYTPSQIEWGTRYGKKRTKGWSCSARIHVELQEPGDSETMRMHREKARADDARTVKQLRRAPAPSLMAALVNTRPPLAAAYVADLPAQGKTTI